MAPSKKITIEKLAQMMQAGFSDMGKSINGRIDSLESRMNEKFEEVDARFDRIENILLRDQDNRITKLEDDMRVVKTSLKK